MDFEAKKAVKGSIGNGRKINKMKISTRVLSRSYYALGRLLFCRLDRLGGTGGNFLKKDLTMFLSFQNEADLYIRSLSLLLT